MKPFAAVLLAGGRSRRMGRDKALLPLPDGRRLWERQWTLLQEMRPAALFLSGPRREEFPREVTCREDDFPGRGPLGGIAAALQAMAPLPHLVVLAVDLPAMTAAYLASLLAQVTVGQGRVPRHPNAGFYEPLAAVYPADVLPDALAALAGEDWSMQRFVRQAGGFLADQIITPGELPLFQNWNGPASLAGERRA